MKANEFVKKFGLGAAIDLWCGAFDLYNNGLQILNGMVCSFPDNQFLFDLVDLKRLIESYKLVESYGGLDKAKKMLLIEQSKPYYYYSNEVVDSLKQAISDMESCL